MALFKAENSRSQTTEENSGKFTPIHLVIAGAMSTNPLILLVGARGFEPPTT